MLTVERVAQMIDHSILLPATTDADLVEGIKMCKRYGVGCVVSKAFQIPRTKALLEGTGITLCCPIGFPQGLNRPEVKRHDAEWALGHGVQEPDTANSTVIERTLHLRPGHPSPSAPSPLGEPVDQGLSAGVA